MSSCVCLVIYDLPGIYSPAVELDFDRKGCIFTNDMKLTRQNMKYFVFILSAMKYKSK